MAPSVLTVLLVNVLCTGDTERTCFREEVPEDTGTFGLSWMINGGATQDRGMLVEAKDPDDELVLSLRYGSEGTFTFRSLKPGGHQICLQPSSSQRPLSAGGVLTVHLDISVGERTNNYAEIAVKDKLTEVQHIQRQQNYQRLRQKRFREVSYNTSMWIFWWPVVRSLYVVAVITSSTNSWY